MENDDRFLRADPRRVEGALRQVSPVNGRGTTATPPTQPPPSIDGPRGAEGSLRRTPFVGVGDAAGSSANSDNFRANAAHRYQEVERHLHSG